MKYENVMILGIAGNFAGHLEQAGEAEDFQKMTFDDPNQPKALFPIYTPSSESDSFLSVYPLSEAGLRAPNNADNLQIEPEVMLLFDVTYVDGAVSTLNPTHFGAFNDCSIRRPGAKKISEKKNWGVASKGISNVVFEIDSFEAGGVIDKYRIASFHGRNGRVEAYGEDCKLNEYSYFHERLISWSIDRMNNQIDTGPAEDIAALLATSGYPEQIMIAIGATRYTDYGHSHFLERDDISMVVVYDGSKYTPEDVMRMAESGKFEKEGMSSIVQKVL
ncbi:conserved hypothetical protein [Vibrio crassostreae]|uniref:DUF5718 family protein n=1 Tax=Vibrio crassostreae TaxID=246167 RepID=UPI0005E03EE0|nr:DUF5718 family protein [Vibrio crassostreae]MDH5951224.1 DUF5718 family protein [Vibrio crassostreae]TCU02937.1 hypothetical protein EDB32_1282 [Vibrio crassostreae]CAK1761643.1 conserved hypothetical protein [Vibrio crassostreae]CAK1778957.1 conserved hypothetical protein [Vibrio crassostreae]CAK1798061.1 conserved hypothetical protein [Vibrio crassostreae]